MSTCDWLDLETLRSQPIMMPKHLFWTLKAYEEPTPCRYTYFGGWCQTITSLSLATLFKVKMLSFILYLSFLFFVRLCDVEISLKGPKLV